MVLDTIMNYNSSSGSQLLPDSWIQMTGAREEPEAKGDFISLVSRTGPEKVDSGHFKLLTTILYISSKTLDTGKFWHF